MHAQTVREKEWNGCKMRRDWRSHERERGEKMRNECMNKLQTNQRPNDSRNEK